MFFKIFHLVKFPYQYQKFLPNSQKFTRMKIFFFTTNSLTIMGSIIEVIISLQLTRQYLQDLKVFKCSENEIEYSCAKNIKVEQHKLKYDQRLIILQLIYYQNRLCMIYVWILLLIIQLDKLYIFLSKKNQLVITIIVLVTA